MSAPEVLVERDGPVGLARLNRPQALNALSRPLVAALGEALDSFERDPGTRVVVVTGFDRAFAAGADLREMAGLESPAAAREALGGHLARWDAAGRLSKPVVAAVAGFALGGGCELAMACDIVIAAETAVFGQPEILLGLIPGAGGTQRLARALGKAAAMDAVLTGRRLAASEALRAGLVSRVVAAEALLPEALKLAREIARLSPAAAAAAKACVRAACEGLPLEEGLLREREAFYGLFSGPHPREGMAAFLEKRPPRFEAA